MNPVVIIAVIGALGFLALSAYLSGNQTLNLATFARNAGFQGQDLVTAVAIALAESGGDPNAVGDKTLAPSNGPSYGLWQINVGDKAHPDLKNVNLFDPQTNANAAFAIYQQAGNSFRPWSTFDPRDGSTPKYLAQVSNANDQVSTS